MEVVGGSVYIVWGYPLGLPRGATSLMPEVDPHLFGGMVENMGTMGGDGKSVPEHGDEQGFVPCRRISCSTIIGSRNPQD